jgi:hypothetical protein
MERKSGIWYSKRRLKKYDGQSVVTELFIQRHVDIMATGGVAPFILNIGTTCRRVVTLTAGDSVT